MLDSILRPVVLPNHLIGQPAPCDFFDARGTLLLRAGAPVSPLAARDQQQRHLYCSAAQANRFAPDNPIAQLHDVAAALATLADDIDCDDDPAAEDFIRLAHALHELWQQDADACIGYMRLAHFHRPSVCHAIHAALLAAELGAANGMAPAAMLNVIGAALTMNIGNMGLHDRLHERTGPLDDDDADDVRAHAFESANRLEQLGRFPEAWIDAVAQHHENVDGSGYPLGLMRANIALPARMLRIADVLAARLSSRRGRGPRYWNLHQTRDLPRLIQHVFGADLAQLDQPLVRQLMARLGAFPPGSLVRLNNGELAVVSRRSSTHDTPREVWAFIGGHGRALEEPRLRKISPRDCRIHSYVHDELPRLPACDWHRVWGYAH